VRQQSSKLHDRIARLVSSKDARVRFQALLVAMPVPKAPKYPADKWEENAMLIAAGNRGGTVLAEMLTNVYLLKSNLGDPDGFVARLARLAAAAKDDQQRAVAIAALVNNEEFDRAGLTGILKETSRQQLSLNDVRQRLSDETRSGLDRVLEAARVEATNGNRPEDERCEAIDLLAYTDNAADVLLPIAAHDPEQGVRLRALAALAKRPENNPWQQLLGNFSRESPAIQRAILDGALSNVERTSLLLDAVAAGQIKATVIDPVRAKLLRTHKDEPTRKRAEKLLAATVPADREKVLAEYRPALTLPADAAHGRQVFEKQCSVCHRIGNVGIQFAPDISDSRERTPLQLLTDIIQPNRAIDSNYFSYTAITQDGRVHTGVLSAETSNSVTLKQQEGKSETLRRDEIEDLHSDGVSFMPEGLDKDIPPQDMADLISFIKNWRYLDNPQEFSPQAK
jgi:putative heme-binding domain-containing protein